MKKMFDEDYNGKYYLQVSEYSNNNRIYIGVVNENEDFVTDVTVNLPDILLENDNQIFLSGDLSDGAKYLLLNKGIISETLDTRNYNMGKYEVVNVNLDVLREYDPNGVDNFLKTKNSDELER